MKVRVVMDGLRRYYIHELNLTGIVDATDKEGLLHPTAFYTLNNIPDGEKVAANELKTGNSNAAKADAAKNASKPTPSVNATKKPTPVATPAKPAPAPPAAAAKAPTTAEIMPLLQKHTCTACHHAEKKLIGPPYAEVAKRNYSNDKIVQLIWKPNPKNWPGYSTEMAPMPHVPKAEALKIAAWINSLKK
jgi:cytochrome c551/c552